MPAKTLRNDDRRASQTLLTRPAPRAARPHRPELGLLAPSRRAAQPHRLTYVIGNALFWTLWAAISLTADPWYWWPIAPFVAWALVLAAHLRRVYRPAPPRLR